MVIERTTRAGGPLGDRKPMDGNITYNGNVRTPPATDIMYMAQARYVLRGWQVTVLRVASFAGHLSTQPVSHAPC